MSKKGDGLLLFLKAFSWETDLWIKKKLKTGKRNPYLTKKLSNKNKICCAEDNHSNMSDRCAKEFQIRGVISKISICKETTPNFAYSQKSYF